MKGFAYRDKYGVLHITDSEVTARQFTGRYITEVDINYEDGYPYVTTDKGQRIHIIDKGNGKVVYSKDHEKVSIDTLPEGLRKEIKSVLENIGI